MADRLVDESEKFYMATKKPNRPHWWAHDASERYWCEITDRPDIGFDLHCPQTDEDGKPVWSYGLINLVGKGDIVVHYSTNEQAFVGASIADGNVINDQILWTPHGTTGRSKKAKRVARPGWKMHLSEFRMASKPLTMDEVQDDQIWIRNWIKSKKTQGSVMAPFQPYPLKLRASQAYLTKLPSGFVSRLPKLKAMSNELAGRSTLNPDQAISDLARSQRSSSTTQGYSVLPAVRIAIESYSMKLARAYFKGEQYKVTTKGKPFDLLCEREGQELYVEVKGTSTVGLEILLTRNEVLFANSHIESMALFVVSKIDVSTDVLNPIASGGEIVLFDPWKIDNQELEPLGYSYKTASPTKSIPMSHLSLVDGETDS